MYTCIVTRYNCSLSKGSFHFHSCALTCMLSFGMNIASYIAYQSCHSHSCISHSCIKMAMYRLRPIIFSKDPSKLIDYLKPKSLLHTQQDCNHCGGIPMEWVCQPIRGDGSVWHCPVCHKTKSIRNDSKSKLPLCTWVQLLHQWAMRYQ